MWPQLQRQFLYWVAVASVMPELDYSVAEESGSSLMNRNAGPKKGSIAIEPKKGQWPD